MTDFENVNVLQPKTANTKAYTEGKSVTNNQ